MARVQKRKEILNLKSKHTSDVAVEPPSLGVLQEDEEAEHGRQRTGPVLQNFATGQAVKGL